MTLFRTDRAIGRYGQTNVSALFRQQASAIFNAGGGVTNARTLLRGVGFRFGNASMTAMFREFREIAAKGPGLNSIRLDFRPTANTITQVQFRTRQRYLYSAKAHLRNVDFDGPPVSGMSFGDDRLLTRREQLERFDAISQQILDHGPEACFLENAAIDRIEITGVFETQDI